MGVTVSFTRSGLQRATYLVVLVTALMIIGCGDGDSPEQVDATATSSTSEGAIGIIPTPVLEFADPSATQAPFSERRDGAFPVNLRPPGVDVAVWTTIRRAGDPEADDELMMITEGFIEPATGYVFDYEITYVDAEGNTYDAEPNLYFGLVAAGERRKFAVAAMMPTDSKLVEITLTPQNGDIARQVIYHVTLPVANIPRTSLLPEGYESAQ